MSDLHAQIMNIPCDRPDTSAMGKNTAYKLGHRDARHAAAEMALSSATPTLSAAMQLPEVRTLVEMCKYLTGENVDHLRIAIAGNPDAIKEMQTRAAAALAPFTEAKP